MGYDEWHKRWLKDKYGRHVEVADSGIFTRDNRRKMYGTKGISGKNVSINNFWYDRRNQVKTSFKDLELFIDTARETDIPQAINLGTTLSLIETLFHSPIILDQKPDPERAKIAHWMIHFCFKYLTHHQKTVMTKQDHGSVSDAIDRARVLANMFLPKEKQQQRIVFSGSDFE